MTLIESQHGTLIDDLQNNVDFTFNGWDPNIQVWRAGEGHKRNLPYVTVDFITLTDKKFASMADIVGRVDDFRYEYAYCEIEVVVISFYANKYHNNGTIRGRDLAKESMIKIRKRILAFWNEILLDFNASIDRGMHTPIKDLTNAYPDVKTRVHEFELTFYLRTDVRWYKEWEDDEVIEERAEKAHIELENVDEPTKKNYLRIEFNG